MRNEGRSFASNRSRPAPPPPKTWTVNRGELDRILSLELLAKGQVADLASGLSIAEGLSERLILEWLHELGHKIG